MLSRNYEELVYFIQELFFNDYNFNLHIRKVYKTINRLDFGQLAALPELYAIIRSLAPQVVVETGVASGLSSAFILHALSRNQHGHLYSIDLPPYTIDYEDTEFVSIPKDFGVGWAIKEEDRESWTLILGDSFNELPKLCKKLGELDIFIHDSRHTYSTMFNEYRTVWPHLKKGGLLISDDISRNDAFRDFSMLVRRKPSFLIAPRIFPAWSGGFVIKSRSLEL
jgi:predicted O-methyltransferase YrrM